MKIFSFNVNQIHKSVNRYKFNFYLPLIVLSSKYVSVFLSSYMVDNKDLHFCIITNSMLRLEELKRYNYPHFKFIMGHLFS